MTFRINRVYTRAGDAGDTGLVGGERIAKNSNRVAAYGDIDELNSVIGIVTTLLTSSTADLLPVLEIIQQQLFDLGSELATPATATYEGMWQANDSHVKKLEDLCDKFGSGLPELTSFILPGGSQLAAALHLARTVCRRAERQIVTLARESEQTGQGPFNDCLIKYTNRLSDLFFVLARWSLAKEGKQPLLWIRSVDRQSD